MLAADAAASADAGGVPPAAQRAIEMIREQAGTDDPSVIAATITSWPVAMLSSLASGVGAVDLTIQGLSGLAVKDPFTGKYVPVDYNTSWQNPYTVSQALNQAQYQRTFDALYADLGDEEAAAKKAQMYQNWYNLTLSMGQSAAIGALTALGVPGAMLLLSGSAATSTMHEMHEQGYSDGYAIAAGLVSGFAEYITEKISIESLLKAGRAGLNSPSGLKRLLTAGLNMAYQTISEGSEEGASDIVNALTDELVSRLFNGGITQIQTEALNKQQADPSLSWEDAMRQSWKDWTHQFGQDVLYGAISGGAMGGGGFAVGGAIQAARDTSLGSSIRQAGAVPMLMDIAASADELSAAASNMEMSRGLNSDRQIGRLARRVADTVVNDSIRERLTQLGEENITPELLRGINEMAQDERLFPADKKAVKNSTHAYQVAQELAEWYENSRNQSEWTADISEQQASLRDLLTDQGAASLHNAVRVNTLQQAYEQAQRNNPDSTVLTPIAEQITQEGGDPKVATQQGKLLAKVLSGEELTAQEFKALDLNNTAVRKVFAARTGLTGIPSGQMSNALKRSYINRVTSEVKSLIQMQEDLGKGTELLEAVNREASIKRAAALSSQKKENKLGDIIKSRSEHEANRRSEAMTDYNAQLKEGKKTKPVETKGRSPEAIIADVKNLSGIQNIETVQEFAARMTAEGTTYNTQAALDTAYRMYLENLVLSKAHVNAMVTAARMMEKGATNDLRRDSGGRQLGSDGRRAAGEVPGQTGQAEQGKTSTGFDLGIPGAAKTGNLTEVTADEVDSDPRLSQARELLVKGGLDAKNVHFVRGNGGAIVIAKNGHNVMVRGLFDPSTMQVWILADDPSSAHLTPYQIAAHELFHYYIKISPALFNEIKQRMSDLGVLTQAERMAADRYAKNPNLFGKDMDYYLEEVMADAHANVNTMRDADAKQFAKLVRQAVADAMLASPADALATDPLMMEPRTSAIEIPEADKDAHHDNYGRKLSKQMECVSMRTRQSR